jgi:TrmH family RNA methyltransferase
MITAKDNPKVKNVVKLVSSAKKRRETGLIVLEGARLCSEALAEGVKVAELFYTSQTEKANAKLLEALKKKAEFYSEVSGEVFEKISDTKSPQGILATVKLSPLFDGTFNGKWIGFEQVADPSNLGAAARTAEALGFGGILISKNGVDPYSPKSLRASMGALLRIPIVVAEDFESSIESLRQEGYKVSGAVIDESAEKINNISFGEKEIILIGNEANGLTAKIKARCHRLITIPMSGRAESLNAAAAAAILMWEMIR